MEMTDKQKQPQPGFRGQFRPTPERLREIGKKGRELMEQPRPEVEDEFREEIADDSAQR
jgi:hypothetical protein